MEHSAGAACGHGPPAYVRAKLELPSFRSFAAPPRSVAPRPLAAQLERELGDDDGVERAVRHEELVEGSGTSGVSEDRPGLHEQADADEPLLVDVPVREVAARNSWRRGSASSRRSKRAKTWNTDFGTSLLVGSPPLCAARSAIRVGRGRSLRGGCARSACRLARRQRRGAGSAAGVAVARRRTARKLGRLRLEAG